LGTAIEKDGHGEFISKKVLGKSVARNLKDNDPRPVLAEIAVWKNLGERSEWKNESELQDSQGLTGEVLY